MKNLLICLVILSLSQSAFAARYQYNTPSKTVKTSTSTTTKTSTTTQTSTKPATTTPTPVTPSPSTPTDLFQASWDSAFLKKIPTSAAYQSFKVLSDKASGLYAGDGVYVDVNYQVLSSNTDPVVDILSPGAWDNRSSGKVRLGRTNVPANFILPDVTASDTPNNPTIIVNKNTKAATYLNGAARPVAGGSIWGYQSSPKQNTHGGSGLIGGEVTAAELSSGVINHAIAINVWGKKYLNKANGGFVAPADRADGGYNVASSGNYYGGTIANLKMGTRLGIPSSVTASKLGVTSKEGLALFNAMKTYGAIIVDNSAWDALYINATPDTVNTLNARRSETAKLFSALQIVN